MSRRQTFWDQNCPIGSHLNFFCRGTPKNAKKCFFFTFGQFTRVFGIGTQIRGTTMRKLRSWAFRKCRTFWVWESPKGSYCCSKSTDFEILGPLAKLRTVPKKSHGNNFDFSDPARNQRGTNPIGKPLIPCQTRKIKIVAVTFFLNASSDPIFFLKNDWTLTANNSPLKSRTPKKYHIFGKFWTCSFTWWYPGYGIVFKKFE